MMKAVISLCLLALPIVFAQDDEAMEYSHIKFSPQEEQRLAEHADQWSAKNEFTGAVNALAIMRFASREEIIQNPFLALIPQTLAQAKRRTLLEFAVALNWLYYFGDQNQRDSMFEVFKHAWTKIKDFAVGELTTSGEKTSMGKYFKVYQNYVRFELEEKQNFVGSLYKTLMYFGKENILQIETHPLAMNFSSQRKELMDMATFFSSKHDGAAFEAMIKDVIVDVLNEEFAKIPEHHSTPGGCCFVTDYVNGHETNQHKHKNMKAEQTIPKDKCPTGSFGVQIIRYAPAISCEALRGADWDPDFVHNAQRAAFAVTKLVELSDEDPIEEVEERRMETDDDKGPLIMAASGFIAKGNLKEVISALINVIERKLFSPTLLYAIYGVRSKVELYWGVSDDDEVAEAKDIEKVNEQKHQLNRGPSEATEATTQPGSTLGQVVAIGCCCMFLGSVLTVAVWFFFFREKGDSVQDDYSEHSTDYEMSANYQDTVDSKQELMLDTQAGDEPVGPETPNPEAPVAVPN